MLLLLRMHMPLLPLLLMLLWVLHRWQLSWLLRGQLLLQ
jgi:hypothetical protein